MIKTLESRKTDETKEVERLLTEAGFDQVDAYRYNSASIRLRVIDPSFEGRPNEERIARVEAILDRMPNERTRDDILILLTLAPSETLEDVAKVPPSARVDRLRKLLLNATFEDPEADDL